MISFTTLSISKSKGKKRIQAVLERISHDFDKDQSNKNINDTSIVIETTQKEDLVETTQAPEVDNLIKFPDGDDNNEAEIYLDDARLTSRLGRAMEQEQWMYRPRVVNRPAYREKHANGPTYYTQVPNFSEQYAQLEGYRHPTRVKSVQDVMSYINTRPTTIATQYGLPTVKFTGVYIKSPMDDDDEHIAYASDFPIYAKPSLNGHAYVSDPFKSYKPSHPSEINHLATNPSEFDTSPRFSNKIVRPTKVPITDPVTSSGSGTLTQAIFHPYNPSTPSYNTKASDKRSKPLKIMLDIYPITPEMDPGTPAIEGIRPNARPALPAASNPLSQNNRMIVHLNLYPKKTNKARRQPLLTSLVPGGGNFENRMFDGPTGSGEVNEDENGSEHDSIVEADGILSTGDDYETTGDASPTPTLLGDDGNATVERWNNDEPSIVDGMNPRLGIGESIDLHSAPDSYDSIEMKGDNREKDFTIEETDNTGPSSNFDYGKTIPSNNSHTPVPNDDLAL